MLVTQDPQPYPDIEPLDQKLQHPSLLTGEEFVPDQSGSSPASACVCLYLAGRDAAHRAAIGARLDDPLAHVIAVEFGLPCACVTGSWPRRSDRRSGP